MKVTKGDQWILSCTPNFQETVIFFRDVLGLAVTDEGTPVTDTQFIRYAQFKLPNETVIEVVEPTEAARPLYNAPVVSIMVDDLAQARRELADRQIEFVAPIFETKEGWAWTYFRAPDGNVYQIQGPYQS